MPPPRELAVVATARDESSTATDVTNPLEAFQALFTHERPPSTDLKM
jgi:hypothetical protein